MKILPIYFIYFPVGLDLSIILLNSSKSDDEKVTNNFEINLEDEHFWKIEIIYKARMYADQIQIQLQFTNISYDVSVCEVEIKNEIHQGIANFNNIIKNIILILFKEEKPCKTFTIVRRRFFSVNEAVCASKSTEISLKQCAKLCKDKLFCSYTYNFANNFCCTFYHVCKKDFKHDKNSLIGETICEYEKDYCPLKNEFEQITTTEEKL